MSANGKGTSIEVDGVGQTIRALKAFTPEIHKTLTKSIKTALNFTKEVTEGKYPQGSWVVRVTQRKMLGVIAARGGGGGWGPPWKPLNELAPGSRAAVLEFIGSAGPAKTPQVAGLLNTINARYGTPGRFLWSAWDETSTAVLQDIRLSVLSAEKKLQAHLDASGESF